MFYLSFSNKNYLNVVIKDFIKWDEKDFAAFEDGVNIMGVAVW